MSIRTPPGNFSQLTRCFIASSTPPTHERSRARANNANVRAIAMNFRNICSLRPTAATPAAAAGEAAQSPDSTIPQSHHPNNPAESGRASAHQALALRADRPGLLPLVRVVRPQRAVAGQRRAKPRGAEEPRGLFHRLPREAQGCWLLMKE